MVKKQKEYKVGKVKDETSNCVFNGIEDYFMWLIDNSDFRDFLFGTSS